MIVISDQSDRPHDSSREATNDEPRQIGELMNAVLARYGISTNAGTAQVRMPALDRQTTLFDALVAAR